MQGQGVRMPLERTERRVVGQQVLDHVAASLAYGPAHCRVSILLGGVRIGAMAQQLVHDVRMPRANRDDEGRAAVLERGIDRRARLQQDAHDIRVAFQDRATERRMAVGSKKNCSYLESSS